MKKPFVSQSRYHGDKFPRTLQEAFGPYAELHVKPRRAAWPGCLFVILILLYIGLVVRAFWP
jgi:hypothetical protein